MSPKPLVSIVIAYLNNFEHLLHCLDCLVQQTFQDFEVILIDNGSREEGIDRLEQKFHGLTIRVEHLTSNLGFAKANNLGAHLARGKWLALLNSDAFPKVDWLEKILEAAHRCPSFTFFSSRQIQFNQPDILDGSGDEYHISGLAWRRFYNHPATDYGLKEEEVFSACAAAAIYDRNDFLMVEGFDESYFSYFEDVDLSFRMRLLGGRCLYVPQAEVYHVGSASSGKTSDFVMYHGHRNLVWTFFKNMPSYLFWLYLPLHITMNLYFASLFLLRGKGSAILRAKMDAFYSLPAIISQRKKIQSARRIPPGEILQVMNTDLFAPYWAMRKRHKRTS